MPPGVDVHSIDAELRGPRMLPPLPHAHTCSVTFHLKGEAASVRHSGDVAKDGGGKRGVGRPKRSESKIARYGGRR